VRLTRKQRQEQTRTMLLAAAGKVLARGGLGAPIDEIARGAGFTKGAFYANFASKDDLFLAMLDERFSDRLAQIERHSGDDGDLDEQVRAAGNDFSRYLSADPDWQRLFFELAVHAARNESFRERMVARCRELCAGLARLIERRSKTLDVELPVDSERLALMLFAIANGFALQKLLAPEEATDELYEQMLGTFFAGLRVVAAERTSAPSA
jgi:AcrR family transcriptional regulator